MEDIRPDWSFMKQLKALDSRLGVKFNGEHFVVTFQRPGQAEYNVWKVVDERGGFRQPDQRELEMLRESNLERIGPDERFNLAREYMERFRSDARERVKDEVKGMTRDSRIQLVQAFRRVAGSGKGNSAFRRIEQ